jgi:hypothetical protein
MGDEEGGEEGEESDHYESMVFNLLTGNTQGYQVYSTYHKKSFLAKLFQPTFLSITGRNNTVPIPGWWLQIRLDLRLFLLNSDLEFSQPGNKMFIRILIRYISGKKSQNYSLYSTYFVVKNGKKLSPKFVH